MQIAATVFALLLAYLAGALPVALWIGRARGVDIRRHGSGNTGATNVFRVVGKPWGVLCLLLDMFKGWLPVYLMTPFYVFASVDWIGIDGWMWVVGLAAVAGHMFSPFLRFKGGKGVATSMGVLLAIAPLPLSICVLVGLFIIWLTGYVSLASIVGSALLPPLIVILDLVRRFEIPWTTVVITLLLAAVIAWKHRGNIKRLRAGTESRLFDRLDEKARAKEGRD